MVGLIFNSFPKYRGSGHAHRCRGKVDGAADDHCAPAGWVGRRRRWRQRVMHGRQSFLDQCNLPQCPSEALGTGEPSFWPGLGQRDCRGPDLLTENSVPLPPVPQSARRIRDPSVVSGSRPTHTHSPQVAMALVAPLWRLWRRCGSAGNGSQAPPPPKHCHVSLLADARCPPTHPSH